MRRIKARVIRNIGTEAQWLQKNPLLGDGEQALVRFGGRVRNKIGNGLLTFSELSYQDADLKISAATPSFSFISGDGPAPAGVFMANGSGKYNGTLDVDTSGKIVMLIWDGVSRLEKVETSLPGIDEIGIAISNKVDKVEGKSLVSDTEIEKLAALPKNTDLNTALAKKVDIVEGKDLSTNDFSDEYKDKVDILKNEGADNKFLNEKGLYEKVTAPIQSIAVNGAQVNPNENGEVSIEIPDAPVQAISLNGVDIAPDENGKVNLETKEGTVRSVTFNGMKLHPDADGDLPLAIDIPDTDQTLDSISTNPVSNSAVTSKFEEIENNTIAGMDAEVSDDETKVTLSLLNKSGDVFSSVEIPAGSGGGGGEGESATKIVLTSVIDKPSIKFGDSAQLTYYYDHQYNSGDDKGQSTGQKATIQITAKNGATEVYRQTINAVSSGSYEFDLTKYIQVGTTDVYVKATVVDVEGKTQTKQSYVTVRAYTLNLNTSYSITNKLNGYGNSDTVTIPFTISGTGNKTIILYVDGVEKETKLVTKSGTTNGTFSLVMTPYANGRHTIQLVSELSLNAVTIKSESIYFDIYKNDANAIHIATKQVFADGRIFTDNHLVPKLQVGQYEQLKFDFAVYDPNNISAAVKIFKNNVLSQTVQVSRTLQVYTNRFDLQGNYPMRFTVDAVNYNFNVEVIESTIDISEVTDSLSLKLSASGRSNSESNPNSWEYGSVKTIFRDFDFNSNGWTGDALKLTNGANIEIPVKPFLTDASANGKTIEFEFTCSNIISKNGAVISCLHNNVGFQVSTQEAYIKSVSGVTVETKFSTNMQFKVAFVIGNRTDDRLLEIYVNGIRCGAVRYGSSDTFLQAVAQNITVTSENADVLLRNIRVYDRALNDDEELANFIVDRETTTEMVSIFQSNDVLDELEQVSLDKLRAKGKSVLRIVGDVDLVNQTNNKKFEVPVTAYFYSAFGKEYDFIVTGAGLRIQGTSSTTYPRKNYRLYFDRKDKYGTILIIGEVEQTKLEYSFMPGSRPVSLFTFKADFAESSSTHNTGLSRLLNDTWKKIGFLTPPQVVDASVRTGIDGFPIDSFYDNNGTNENKYLGKYNFNYDKSGSADVYGFEDVPGFNDAAALNGAANKCICLEFLNNSFALGLFKSDDMSGFADALEFRYPEDLTWADSTAAQKSAIQRLWTWVKSCESNPTKFGNEVAQYFNLDSLLAWYVATEYFMMVDQRVKNMMLVTWDGLTWYFIPYDSDTILGVRNDGKLVYDYTITEETYDASILSYAYAGHDSVLWKLVRATQSARLESVAQQIRASMSKESVLKMFNEEMMGNWSERIYNKDANYKYIKPLSESNIDYLYSLQGSRFAHRSYIINNRFDLLDAKYLAGTYRADNLRIYFGAKFSTNKQNILITASERYYFGYGYTSGVPHQSGTIAEAEDSIVKMIMDTDLIVNDPQYFYGASRMKEVDFRNVSQFIVNNLDFSNCRSIQKIDLFCAATQSTLTGITLTSNQALTELNVNGMLNPAFTSLDLSRNSRLTKLTAGNTKLTGIELAPGAPLISITLPLTLQTLKLKSLTKLTNAGISFSYGPGVRTLIIENCPLVDWNALFDMLSGTIQNIRITGINMSGDKSVLNKYISKGGIDAEGNIVSTPRLVGKFQLTTFLSDAEFITLKSNFPELEILQPEFSVYTVYDKDPTTGALILDPKNVFNPDNKTGYGTGKEYVASGHILEILKKRHRYLGKQAKKGTMTVCQLHDANSAYYNDAPVLENCTPAKLDGSEGDIWVYEPAYWYKGVTDYRTKITHACFSSNKTRPSIPGNTIKLTYQQLLNDGSVDGNFYLNNTAPNVQTAKTSHVDYQIIKVSVKGYKKIKYQTSSKVITEITNSLFADVNGNIISKIADLTKDKYTTGTDLVETIPANAEYLYVSCFKLFNDFTACLTNSDNLIDIEPEWVEVKEKLVCYGLVSYIGNNFRSVNGDDYNFLPLDLIDENLSKRSLSIFNYNTKKDIGNLWYFKSGDREIQAKIGRSYTIDVKKNGSSLAYGMEETVNYGSNQPHYKRVSAIGDVTYIASPVIVSMGYENLYNGAAAVNSFNDFNARFYINYIAIQQVQIDGRADKKYVTGIQDWVRYVQWGRHLDTFACGEETSSSATFYCDQQATLYNLLRITNSSAGLEHGIFSLNTESITGKVNNRFKVMFDKIIQITENVTQYKNIIDVTL